MRSILTQADPGAAARTRMIWLPGAFQRAEEFLEAGFDAAARARNLAMDLEFVQLELAHVGDRRFIDELALDIVAPARAAGCRTLWLAGISLGGFFALDYASRGADCDGLCLIAPYLGSRRLIAEIAAAPGLAAWQAGPLAQADEERRIWRFIQRRVGAPEPRPKSLVLAYGRDDRFARAQALLAATLPHHTVQVADGGHDWPTWSALWEHLLGSTIL